jgi:hypothetical protein
MSGKLVKVPIPEKVISKGADLSAWIEQSEYVQEIRRQSDNQAKREEIAISNRFQFVWYGFHWRNWIRLFYEPNLMRVYRWRIAFGPIDIRRWR